MTSLSQAYIEMKFTTFQPDAISVAESLTLILFENIDAYILE